MASDSDEFDKNIENSKATVRKSFALVYATLKARELKTLRQLDAIRKQCQNDENLRRNCNQNIEISYQDESKLLDHVNNYGAIDFEKLNIDSNTFSLEDYISPEVDHMYSYKTIEELTKETDTSELAIEEAALKQITATENCVCFVNIRKEDVSRKFRDVEPMTAPVKTANVNLENTEEIECVEDITEDGKSDSSDAEIKKIDPTDDWLNSIKGQTETEPTQVTDVMEHSTITCP